jgi:hypothetical protein
MRPGQLRRSAPTPAITNHVEKEFDPHNDLSFRNELVNDIDGQRTRYQTLSSEHLIRYGHRVGSAVLLRPERRREHPYNAAACDNSHKNHAMDSRRRHHLLLLAPPNGATTMADIASVAATIAFFLLAIAYAQGCDRLGTKEVRS